MTKHAIIIGAGLGGLITACRLSKAGLQITVVEKNSKPGGRCNTVELNGQRFDTGPTLFVMKDIISEIFLESGESIDSYLEFIPLDPYYNIFYNDGSKISLYSDRLKMNNQIEKIEKSSSTQWELFKDTPLYPYLTRTQKLMYLKYLKSL